MGQHRWNARRAALLLGLVLGVLPVCGLAQGSTVQVKFSGILGQSQATGTEACPSSNTLGVALDQSGKLWTSAGEKLIGFTRAAGETRWTLTDKINLPAPSNQLGVRWDGERLYTTCWNGKCLAIDPTQKTCVPTFSFSDKMRDYAIAPAGLSKGFAAKAKFFTLEGDVVNAFTKDGAPLGPVLNLTRPANAQWWYTTLLVEPNTGDLLVGSYYDNLTIYRFMVDGKQVTTDGWPRHNIFSMMLTSIGDTAWALTGGGGAVSLPNVQKTAADIKTIDRAFSVYSTGLIADPQGGYWMAASQGIVQYDRDGKPAQVRIGGVSGVRHLAVLADGTLLGTIENGGRVIRLSISDEPNGAFHSGGDEPWRIGENWTSTAVGIVPDGDAFIILDDKAKQLWRYDPTRDTNNRFWSKLSVANAFTAPRALAGGDSLLWVLDGSQLVETKRTAPLAPKAVTLPGIDLQTIAFLASGSDAQMVVATYSSVSAFTRSADGAYTKAWDGDLPFRTIGDMAAAGDYIFVLDKDAKAISVLSAKTGEVLAKYSGEQVPGGFQPVAITANSRWLLVADETGKRILRLKVSVK